ncbi:hypothetical protein NDU88_005158 [Pleurodeles waltl]|uniref:Uncharacterized protein n=1 Tax=Pleurodeles waltl TaxID=8319 RepID=A0AAV7PHR2_PLEWA|nr:hypothetical protein NDU88_005158 [Pleurodeles waltl]
MAARCNARFWPLHSTVPAASSVLPFVTATGGESSWIGERHMEWCWPVEALGTDAGLQTLQGKDARTSRAA